MARNRSPLTFGTDQMCSHGNDRVGAFAFDRLAHKFEIKPVAEKKIQQLPPGPLFWRIDNFPRWRKRRPQRVRPRWPPKWRARFGSSRLVRKAAHLPGGSKVAEIGPVPPITAPEYLLRINNTGGPPGVKTPVHTHPGSETFYVLTGQLGQKTPHGESHVDAGQSMPGHGPGMPMEVSSSGTTDLNALVMFVVDATKPFSSPATMP